jgi:hypothetical protein
VGSIPPTRDIRQRDHLSPYLFILCSEAISSLLQHAKKIGKLIGIPTCKKGPKLNHIFFADDSLLFCKANSLHLGRLTRLLEIYDKASIHKLNRAKTSIFFSRNTSQVDRDRILKIYGIPATQRYDNYLGLLALVGKSKSKAFKSIKDRVWKKLND